MIVSSTAEAFVFNLRASRQDIDESNRLLAQVIASSKELPPSQIKERVMDEYVIAGSDVVDYNRKNIYSH